VDLNNVAQYWQKCSAVVSTTTTSGLHEMQEHSWLYEEVSAARERLCCMELFGWLVDLLID
jgi:hypothetical protein